MPGAVLDMPKKKAGKKAANPVTREDFIRVRMSSEFKGWLQRYADFRNLTVAATVIQSLIDDAKVRGFAEAAPKR